MTLTQATGGWLAYYLVTSHDKESGVLTYMYMNDQSLRQGKSKQLHTCMPEDYSFFPREREELPCRQDISAVCVCVCVCVWRGNIN